MEQLSEELRAHLMATDPEYRTLAEEHAKLKQQLTVIESKAHLTIDDEDQEHQIKKQKLHVKDQMNTIVARYKTQQVA